MNSFLRYIIRTAIFLAYTTIIWLIAEQLFDRLDQRMPIILAGIITYGLIAYIALPLFIRILLTLFRRKKIPRYTHTGDGLLADPVNIIFIGTENKLIAVFEKIGWHQSDKTTINSAWKISKAILQNKPYPNAPFSSLYLFGRREDYGFQQPITISPRKRHHIRLWEAHINLDTDIDNHTYWSSKHSIKPDQETVWIGAASKDVGISVKKSTYQFTHATEKQIDEEREYILSLLKQHNCIGAEYYVEPNTSINGKYISDGKILVLTLR